LGIEEKVSLAESLKVAKEKAKFAQEEQQQALETARLQAQAAAPTVGAFGATTAADRALATGLQKEVGRAQTVAEFNIRQLDKGIAASEKKVQDILAKRTGADITERSKLNKQLIESFADLEKQRADKERLSIAEEEETTALGSKAFQAATESIDSFVEGIGMEGLSILNVDSLTNFINTSTTGLNDAERDSITQRVLAQKALAKEISEAKTPDEKAGLLATFKRLGISPSTAVQEAGATQILNQQLKAGEITQAEFDKFNNILTGAKQVDSAITASEESGSIQPTGKMDTQSFAGREVTLDTGAMVAFELANEASVDAGIGEIQIGGTSTSSTRDQSATIAGMVSKWNGENPADPIEFNADRPNDSAAALRARNINVSNVGSSKHENGLALDIYPDPSYIAKVKPFLEANGWKQTIPVGDAGHFEFMGLDKGISETDADILSIQIGKTAFGTRISDPEGAKVDRIVKNLIKEDSTISKEEFQ